MVRGWLVRVDRDTLLVVLIINHVSRTERRLVRYRQLTAALCHKHSNPLIMWLRVRTTSVIAISVVNYTQVILNVRFKPADRQHSIRERHFLMYLACVFISSRLKTIAGRAGIPAARIVTFMPCLRSTISFLCCKKYCVCLGVCLYMFYHKLYSSRMLFNIYTVFVYAVSDTDETNYIGRS